MTVQDVSCFTCAETCDALDRMECFHRFSISWTPVDASLCNGCDMYSDKYGCCRHAEPCYMNGYNDEKSKKKWNNEYNKKIYRREHRMYRRVLGDNEYERTFTSRGKGIGPRKRSVNTG